LRDFGTLAAMLRVSLISLLSFVALGAGVGCKPGVGSSCDQGESRCLNPNRALVCQKRVFIETPCLGKDGCRVEPAGVACDIRGNRAGDPCSTDEEGAAMCADEKTLIACRKGKYARVPCRGPGGCTQDGANAHCDATVAEVGEPCAEEDKKACATNGRSVLACDKGRMTPKYECRGEHGCRVLERKVDCDLTIARLGDACDKLVEGTFACSEDARAIVRCESGKFVADEKCKGQARCLVEPGSTRCAKPE
jgi:hypothetical protein